MKCNFLRHWTFVCVFLFSSVVTFAKIEMTPVYVFGFSASFTDSVAYITDIQQLDSAYIDNKTGFLVDRAVYSDQLQTFIEATKEHSNSTCAVFFHTKRNKLVDAFNKLKKQYAEEKTLILKSIAGEGFRFQSPKHEELVAVKNKNKKKANK